MTPRNRCETLRRVAEAVVLGMVCLAPWAYGSVDAWAEFGLYVGTALIGLLVSLADGASSRLRRLLCLPSLALGGLVILALVQVAPLPEGLFRWVSPSSAALRAELLPAMPERVVGDPNPTIPLPRPRLSQDPDQTIQMAARLAAGWLLFQGVLSLGGSPAVIRRLAVGFSINATLLSLFSIIQALTWNGRIFWIRSSPSANGWSGGGPFVCHTHLAEYLNMGVGFALGLVAPGGWRDLLHGKTYRLGAAYAMVVIAAGIVASNSRGGFLSMVVAGSILVLLLRPHPVRLGIGVTAFLGMLVLILSALGGDSPYLNRIATIIDLGDGGYSIRIEIWQSAIKAWRIYPVWGTGLGSFPSGTAPFLEYDRGVFNSRAENEYVDLLAEGGLVGIGLLMIGVIGLVRMAHQAFIKTSLPRDQWLILGAIFGLLALGFNSLSDFGPHIPGVGVPAIVLIGSLCRVGLADTTSKKKNDGSRLLSLSRLGWVASGSGTIVLGFALVSQGVTNTRMEAQLLEANIPIPGESTPATGSLGRSRDELDRQRKTLEAILQWRPGWADGHLRLGVIHLCLYETMAARWIRESGAKGADLASDPLWLFGLVHDARRQGFGAIPVTSLLEHDPVRLHLVPAARSFLEARRSRPTSAITHAELASLDYLLESGDPTSTYLSRALLLAGGSSQTLSFSAAVAARSGDLTLAARCWRKALKVSREGWTAVADASANSLTPDRILNEVVPNGQLAYRFAERLYPDAESRPIRDRFLRLAAQKLPEDQDLKPAERLQLEARAWAALDEVQPAQERMEAALALEPRSFSWRKDLIDWLLRWKKFREAHEQSTIWLYFDPKSKEAREALDRTAEALARQATGF